MKKQKRDPLAIERDRAEIEKLESEVWEAEGSQPHIVAAGNTLLSGAAVYGPFKNWNEAVNWAEEVAFWDVYTALPLMTHKQGVAHAYGRVRDADGTPAQDSPYQEGK